MRNLEITDHTRLTINVTILGALVLGVFSLATFINKAANKLDTLEAEIYSLKNRVNYRWTYIMEKESWRQAEQINDGFTAPPVKEIREEYTPKSDYE